MSKNLNTSNFTDAKNRCRRCNRPIGDLTATYGWRCAQIVGLNNYNNITATLDNDALELYNAYVNKYMEGSITNHINFASISRTGLNAYNNSRIAYLINNDNAYLSKLDEAISRSEDGKISQYLDVYFEEDDLYYSVHAANVYVDGYRQSNGHWLVKATMTDKYDFTVIQSLMSQDGSFSAEMGLGTIANDAAVISQLLGAINPYNVTVEFYTTR